VQDSRIIEFFPGRLERNWWQNGGSAAVKLALVEIILPASIEVLG
jgi:hypothetical protein